MTNKEKIEKIKNVIREYAGEIDPENTILTKKEVVDEAIREMTIKDISEYIYNATECLEKIFIILYKGDEEK